MTVNGSPSIIDTNKECHDTKAMHTLVDQSPKQRRSKQQTPQYFSDQESLKATKNVLNKKVIQHENMLQISRARECVSKQLESITRWNKQMDQWEEDHLNIKTCWKEAIQSVSSPGASPSAVHISTRSSSRSGTDEPVRGHSRRRFIEHTPLVQKKSQISSPDDVNCAAEGCQPSRLNSLSIPHARVLPIHVPHLRIL
eukprot:GHVL01040649.1.p1 GENE.GHVL01040649.1~~GHVL01040649.1.p1  ORF type:complete len:198 (-),score=25.56 GHVL01040649.1:22-615(-)